MIEKKPTENSRPAGETQGKDTIISAHTGLSIKKWLTENYHSSFTTDDVNQLFDVSLTDEEIHKIYKGDFTVNIPKFSFYRAPVNIKNKQPTAEIDLLRLFKAISGTHYKGLTERYRSMEPGAAKAEFKKTKFDFVTFAGVFNIRKAEYLKFLSFYGVFDYDHLPEVETLKNLLILDKDLDCQMIFVSPSGDGLKIVVFNEDGAPYNVFYASVTDYLKKQYPTFAGFLDTQTKDVSRTCFICHDPNCYIKPQYLELWPASKN